MKIFGAGAGTVELPETPTFHHPDFGYTIYEDIDDPRDPTGLQAIAMHVPPNASSKTWRLVETGYAEDVEILGGSARLVIFRESANKWEVLTLDEDNPTAGDTRIGYGDSFCVVAGSDGALVLSRPLKQFDIAYEQDVTHHPSDLLAQYMMYAATAYSRETILEPAH